MIRHSILAGTWYPGDRDELKECVVAMLDGAEDCSIGAEIRGVIVPHAGYAYSGETAAAGYRQLRGRSYDHVIILSPRHRYGDARYVTSAATAYATPLGEVPVNQEILSTLSCDIELERVSRDDEHAIEIQLPFLQTVLHAFDIVPLMVGHAGLDDADDLIEALFSVCTGRRVLLVASSDLHHLDDYRRVARQDGELAAALERYDIRAVKDILEGYDCTVCGKVPITAVLTVLRRMGARHLQIIQRTTSAEVTGERIRGQYTVGYLSAVLY
ncbi:AmmeMemoRadiSam system protein B [bacterium]|nr:AmmeMemoRadiSam system protein B [bacterium]